MLNLNWPDLTLPPINQPVLPSASYFYKDKKMNIQDMIHTLQITAEIEDGKDTVVGDFLREVVATLEEDQRVIALLAPMNKRMLAEIEEYRPWRELNEDIQRLKDRLGDDVVAQNVRQKEMLEMMERNRAALKAKWINEAAVTEIWPAASEQAPVAWFDEDYYLMGDEAYTSFTVFRKKPYTDEVDYVPLYLHPTTLTQAERDAIGAEYLEAAANEINARSPRLRVWQELTAMAAKLRGE